MSQDHSRVSPAGQRLGANMARLSQIGLDSMAEYSIPDTRCPSCAFRLGTVPNGCAMTQLDILKCVAEDVPFMCHAPRDGRLCHGYVAASLAALDHPLPAHIKGFVAGYDFSPAESES